MRSLTSLHTNIQSNPTYPKSSIRSIKPCKTGEQMIVSRQYVIDSISYRHNFEWREMPRNANMSVPKTVWKVSLILNVFMVTTCFTKGGKGFHLGLKSVPTCRYSRQESPIIGWLWTTKETVKISVQGDGEVGIKNRVNPTTWHLQCR